MNYKNEKRIKLDDSHYLQSLDIRIRKEKKM